MSAVDTNIAGALSKMAAQIPHDTALVAPNGSKGGEPQYLSLTYKELEERSNKAAAFVNWASRTVVGSYSW